MADLILEDQLSLSRVGRNDPCPCGSGRKFKKCCLFKISEMKRGRTERSGYIRKLIDWVFSQPRLQKEYEELVEDLGLEENEENIKAATEAFLFEYRLSSGETPLALFIKKASLDLLERRLYQGWLKSLFSFFEVKKVMVGYGLILFDMCGKGSFTIKEFAGTFQIKEGEILVTRIAPFESYYIMTGGMSYRFPKEAFNYLKKEKKKILRGGLSQLTYLEVFGKKRDDQETWLKRKLRKKLKRLGIKIDFRTLPRRLKKKDPYQAFPEVFNYPFTSAKDFNETQALLHQVWQEEVKKRVPVEELPGPKEQEMVKDLIKLMDKNIKPQKCHSQKEFNAQVKKQQEKWLHTPQKKLAFRTPWEVIKEERRALGKKRQGFHYRMTVTWLPDFDQNKAQKLFQEGLSVFSQGNLFIAQEKFFQVVKIFPKNYVAWANLGMSLALLGKKGKAIDCFKKALKIKPDYQFAKDKLVWVKTISAKELVQLGVTGILLGGFESRKRKKRKRKKDFDVWQMIFEKKGRGRKRSKEE